jgi:hypothetical protein
MTAKEMRAQLRMGTTTASLSIIALVGGVIAIAFLKPKAEIEVSTAGAPALAR